MNSFTHALRQTLPRAPTTTNLLPKSFVRYESSSRRTTKKLRLHPHPSMKLTADSPKTDHIIYNPPSAAPTPLITPTLFLPKDDPRRALFAAVNEVKTDAPLPPPIRTPYEKTYHLTPTDMKQIRNLRKQDPVRWNRTALAKEFNCSSLFIGMVCQATDSRLATMAAVAAKQKARWGPKRAIAREDRQRRRAGWGGADGL